MSQHTTELYFEAHVTIDPVLDVQQIGALTALVRPYGFRVAELLMKKGLHKSRLDDFMTTRGPDYDDIVTRTEECVAELTSAGYAVRRYKIENTLLDVRLRSA